MGSNPSRATNLRKAPLDGWRLVLKTRVTARSGVRFLRLPPGTAQPVRLPGLPAKQCVPDRVSGSCPGLSAISARVAQRQCTALVRRRSRIIPERGLREGKAGGSGSRSVKPILNRERIETSPSHHALLAQRQSSRSISGRRSVRFRQGIPVRGSVIQRQNSWLLTSL